MAGNRIAGADGRPRRSGSRSSSRPGRLPRILGWPPTATWLSVSSPVPRHYEGGASNLTVGGNAQSAWNNGRATSSGHDDVIVYAGRNWTGRAGCIRLGQKGDLAGGLVNNVHSYRWVTPATCNRFPTALDLRRR
jgi:hypothetical protein